MKTHYYLLSVSGSDRTGIVAAVANELFRHGCNLEDSSMMRLGSEFGIFLIFTRRAAANSDWEMALLERLRTRHALQAVLKRLTKKEAVSRGPQRAKAVVSVYGPDRPGIVARITTYLFARRFNITDLSTHRTTTGLRPGYILVIEGEPFSIGSLPTLRRGLERLGSALKTRVAVKDVTSAKL